MVRYGRLAGLEKRIAAPEVIVAAIEAPHSDIIETLPDQDEELQELEEEERYGDPD